MFHLGILVLEKFNGWKLNAEQEFVVMLLLLLLLLLLLCACDLSMPFSISQYSAPPTGSGEKLVKTSNNFS